MNAAVQLHLACAPEVLYRGQGFTFWHGGVTDGPHGLALVVEVLDNSGGGRMAGEEWLSSPLRRWPVELTAVITDAPPARPHEIVEVRSPDFYRLIATFGRYGRSVGPKPAADGLWLEFAVHPLNVRLTRQLAPWGVTVEAAGSGSPAPAVGGTPG